MKDPMFFNKLAGAGLSAALIFFGLPHIASALRGGEHHVAGEEHELELAYPIEWKKDGAGGEAEAGVASPDLGTLLAAATAAGGERKAAICKGCHTMEEGGANGTGPNLWGIVDRAVASHAGFKYTGELTAAGGVWSYDRLDKYLENSQAYIPGTAMIQRFPKADQRADILAYLATLSDAPVPFPAPAVAEAPAAAVAEAPAEAATTETPAEVPADASVEPAEAASEPAPQ
jgi:cytochrome c